MILSLVISNIIYIYVFRGLSNLRDNAERLVARLILTGFYIFIYGVCILPILNEFLKVYFAPHLFIVEYLRHLIK